MKPLVRIFIVVLALLATVDIEAFAQRRGGGGRGGGGRGGGMRAGGGGGGRGFSSRGAARPSVSGRGGFSGSRGFNRPSQLPSRGRSPNRGQIGQRPGQRPGRGQGQRPSQLPNRGNINTGDRVTNIGDRNNVNVDRDGAINVNGDGDNWGGCCDYDNDYPWGAGLAVGAAAAWTAAAIGSTVYTLPPSCTSVYVNGVTYNECGGTYYMPQFEGSTTSYVVVEDPD